MSTPERALQRRRRFLKLGGLLTGATALGVPAAIAAYNNLLSPEARRTRRVNTLDRSVGNSLERLLLLNAGIRQVASEAFAAQMLDSYGLTYDPVELSQRIKILNGADFRRAILEDSGCINQTIPTDKSGLSSPGFDFAYVDAEAVHQNAQGVLSITREAISAANHELGHEVPIKVIDPTKAAIFQPAVTNPGWNVVGVQGFALIIEVPSSNKPNDSCLGRPTEELLQIEEAKVEIDRIGANSKAGLGIKGVKSYEPLVEKMERLFLARLSRDDRRKFGAMHASSDLEGLLGFYKQNFNFQGTLPEAYTLMNRMLTTIFD